MRTSQVFQRQVARGWQTRVPARAHLRTQVGGNVSPGKALRALGDQSALTSGCRSTIYGRESEAERGREGGRCARRARSQRAPPCLRISRRTPDLNFGVSFANQLQPPSARAAPELPSHFPRCKSAPSVRGYVSISLGAGGEFFPFVIYRVSY